MASAASTRQAQAHSIAQTHPDTRAKPRWLAAKSHAAAVVGAVMLEFTSPHSDGRRRGVHRGGQDRRRSTRLPRHRHRRPGLPPSMIGPISSASAQGGPPTPVVDEPRPVHIGPAPGVERELDRGLGQDSETRHVDSPEVPGQRPVIRLARSSAPRFRSVVDCRRCSSTWRTSYPCGAWQVLLGRLSHAGLGSRVFLCQAAVQPCGPGPWAIKRQKRQESLIRSCRSQPSLLRFLRGR